MINAPYVLTKRAVSNVTEDKPYSHTAFASDIGLPPGTWPERLVAALGNGRVLVRTGVEYTRDGDLAAVTYTQDLGCVTLKIYNT